MGKSDTDYNMFHSRPVEEKSLEEITRERVKKGEIDYGLLGNWAIEIAKEDLERDRVGIENKEDY